VEIFFWNKTARTEKVKTGESGKTGKNSKIPKFKHKGNLRTEFV